jgi:hypothetical protein
MSEGDILGDHTAEYIRIVSERVAFVSVAIRIADHADLWARSVNNDSLHPISF